MFKTQRTDGLRDTKKSKDSNEICIIQIVEKIEYYKNNNIHYSVSTDKQ